MLTNKYLKVYKKLMKTSRRGETIRDFVLAEVEAHGQDLAAHVAKKIGISRQAVSKHSKRLVIGGELTAQGNTRHRSYRLRILAEHEFNYAITPGLDEDKAWRLQIAAVLGKLPQNVLDIWNFCFTEMFNNAVDHSEGDKLLVQMIGTTADTMICLRDNGVGIFRKIQSAMNLLDERHAVLELAKGKLTTDPKRHTGQGIFFTSRLLDSFDIWSGGVFFTHKFGFDEDWISEHPGFKSGTCVMMRLDNRSERIDKGIFDQYSSGEDYGFTKTVVPVRLAQYSEERLISRSQAKRLLARVDLFKTVVFDCEGVAVIGQAFADEIFRVFARNHSGIELVTMNALPQVQQQIQSARSQLARETGGV